MKSKALTLAVAALLTFGSGALALANNNTPGNTIPMSTASINDQRDDRMQTQTVTEFKPVTTIPNEETGGTIDIYQYTGIVNEIRDKDIVMKGDDGKIYSIQFHVFMDSTSFKTLDLKTGDRISVKSCKADNFEALKDSTICIGSKTSDRKISFPCVEGDVTGMEIVTPQEIIANNVALNIGTAIGEVLK